MPFPFPFPEAFPKSFPAVSNGTGSELRDLLPGRFGGLDGNTNVSAKGTPSCLHLGFALQGCGRAMPRAGGLRQHLATLSGEWQLGPGAVSGCHLVMEGTRAPSSAAAAAAGGVWTVAALAGRFCSVFF